MNIHFVIVALLVTWIALAAVAHIVSAKLKEIDVRLKTAGKSLTNRLAEVVSRQRIDHEFLSERIAGIESPYRQYRITCNGSYYRVEVIDPARRGTQRCVINASGVSSSVYDPFYTPVSEAQHLDYTGALNELARTMSDKGEPTFTEVKL